MSHDTPAESPESVLYEYNHEDELYQSQNKVHEQLEDDIYDGIHEDETYEIEIAVNDQFEDDMNDDTFAESPDNTSDKFNHKDKSNQSQNSALKQLGDDVSNDIDKKDVVKTSEKIVASLIMQKIEDAVQICEERMQLEKSSALKRKSLNLPSEDPKDSLNPGGTHQYVNISCTVDIENIGVCGYSLPSAPKKRRLSDDIFIDQLN